MVTFLTEVCLPRSCNTADLEFFITELNAYYITTSISDKYSVLYVANSTICQDSKRVPFNTGAIVMIIVCLLFLVLSLVGTAVDIGIKIFQSLMEKSDFCKDFPKLSQTAVTVVKKTLPSPHNPWPPCQVQGISTKKLTFLYPLRNRWNSSLLFP